jgi:hypothetical protein
MTAWARRRVWVELAEAPLRPFWESWLLELEPELLLLLDPVGEAPFSHSGRARFSLVLQGAAVGHASALRRPYGPRPGPPPTGPQPANSVGRAVGHAVEYSVGNAVGHPEVPVTDARVLDGATVQVAEAVPAAAPVEDPELDDPLVLALTSGFTWLPPFALEKLQSKDP